MTSIWASLPERRVPRSCSSNGPSTSQAGAGLDVARTVRPPPRRSQRVSVEAGPEPAGLGQLVVGVRRLAVLDEGLQHLRGAHEVPARREGAAVGAPVVGRGA